MLVVGPEAALQPPLSAAATQTSVVVAVRIRPLTATETNQMEPSTTRPGSSNSRGVYSVPLRKIVYPVDEQVLVFDPPDETDANEGSDRNNRWANPGNKVLSSRKKKDMRFAFDRVFDEDSTQEDVFVATTKPLIDGVLNGFSSTVFAYGATGCGKTYTVAGSPDNPGIIFLTLRELFRKMDEIRDEKSVKISLSYLEVYNEQIRDLLKPSAGKPVHLALREDKSGVLVAGLSEHFPESVDDVMNLILRGNAARTMSPTEANAVSSRSHAVLRIYIRQQPRTASIHTDVTLSTMSVIDLAGSERASASKNRGDRQLEGANINKSLLALGNCINALRDKGPKTHIPYRNSKLTRLLKSSLGGNCKTVMIVCVSPASIHLEETRNTLKYASRAREIKTTISRNKFSVDQHLMRYTQIIAELKAEVANLKEKLASQTFTSCDVDDMGVQHLALADREVTVNPVPTSRHIDESPDAYKIRQLYSVIAARERERAHATAMMDYVDGRINVLQSWCDSYTSASEDTKDRTSANDSYSSVVESLVEELKNERKRLRVDAEKAKAQADLRRQLVNPKRINGTQAESMRELLDLETTTMSQEESLAATKAALSQTELHNSQLMILNAQCLAGMKACVVDAQKAGLSSAKFLNNTYMSAISTFAEITKRNQGSVLPPNSAPSSPISFSVPIPAAQLATGPSYGSSGSNVNSRTTQASRSKSSQSTTTRPKFPFGNGSTALSSSTSSSVLSGSVGLSANRSNNLPSASGTDDGPSQSRTATSLSSGAMRSTNQGSSNLVRSNRPSSSVRTASSLSSTTPCFRSDSSSLIQVGTPEPSETSTIPCSRPLLKPKSILRKKMGASQPSSTLNASLDLSPSSTFTTASKRVIFQDQVPDIPTNAIMTSTGKNVGFRRPNHSSDLYAIQEVKFEDEQGADADDDSFRRTVSHSPKKRSAPLLQSSSSFSSSRTTTDDAFRRKSMGGSHHNGLHMIQEDGEVSSSYTTQDPELVVRKRMRVGSGGNGSSGSWEVKDATSVSSASSASFRPLFAKTSRKAAVPIWK